MFQISNTLSKPSAVALRAIRKVVRHMKMRSLSGSGHHDSG